jgi:hypothetical protein
MEEGKKRNFLSHVFDFEEDSRNELLNLAQYSVLAAVFVTVLNRTFEAYMPEPERDKTTVALALETILHLVLLFLGLVFIHRIIEYIPTFSGAKYGSYNIIPTVLPMLVVLLSLNSGVGRKVSILVDKFNGMSAPPPKQQQQHQPSAISPPHAVPPALSLLPQGTNTLSNPMGQSAIPGPQGDPDFGGMFEPVAANAGGVSLF